MKERKVKEKKKLREATNMFEDLELDEEEGNGERAEGKEVEEEVPLVIQLDEHYYLILSKPGMWYKLQGVERIVFAAGEFKFNDVLNQFSSDQRDGLLELSDVVEQAKTNTQSMLKSLGLKTDIIKQYDKLLDVCAPLIIESESLKVEESYPPWGNKVYEVLGAAIEAKEYSLLVAGNKNSGKSTLCEFALNHLYENGREVCLLDIDLGKGRGLPATINLYVHSKDSDQTITYWIGEYTPLNYHHLYVESVKKIIEIFRAKYFTHVLLVNTMGYLTGFGEMIMKQIYEIVDPTEVLFLSKQHERNQFDAFKNQLVADEASRVKGGNRKDQARRFTYVLNPHASSKGNVESKSKRYEERLGFSSLQNFFGKQFKELIFHEIYIQAQDGQIIKKLFDPFYTNFSLLIICDQQGPLLRFKGLGYGFNNKVFGEQKGQICIKSEVGQFQKQFYDISQKQLISLEQTMECESPFILPSYRGLGMMGYRNLTSKNIRP